MSLKWRDINVEKPKHGQKCLTRLCHGPMTGFYSAPHNMFHAWFYGEREWKAKHWVPIEEIDSEPPKDTVASANNAANLLCDLVRAYEREVNPASRWQDTALTEQEWDEATAEYRAAKMWMEEQ